MKTGEQESDAKLFLKLEKLPVAAVIAAGSDQLLGGLEVDARRVGLALLDRESGKFEMGVAFEETHAAAGRKAHHLVEVTP